MLIPSPHPERMTFKNLAFSKEYKILTNVPGDSVIGDPETNI